jgi:Zn-dependent M28 family amino/carboxypeptidase
MSLTQLTENLRAHVHRLAATPRPPGSEAHRQAAIYIREQLQQTGFVVDEMPFNEAGFSGCNLLTRPFPDQPNLPLLLIGAHYDSIPDSPGADDNASAVAALLELARWLQTQRDSFGRLFKRVQLAAYDLEEYGLIGSFLHAREMRQAGTVVLRGMISLEMLGYTNSRPGSQRLPPPLVGMYPDVANFIGLVGNEASQDLLRTVVGAMKSVPGLPVEYMAVPGDGQLVPETRLSDHASFWDFRYPALMITDTSFFRNPHYHRASDTPETLDYPFLAKVTTGVCAAAREMLQQE